MGAKEGEEFQESGASSGPVTKINLNAVPKDIPEEVPKPVPLSSIKKAGYWLAIFTLCIISAFVVFIALITSIKELDTTSYLTNNAAIAKQANTNLELLKLISEEKKAYRDFLLELTQTILLNLLLPILTAILGYIFGSREDKN